MGALEAVLTRRCVDSTAFVEPDGREWRADEFAGFVLAIDATLTGAGVVPGDRVALLLPKTMTSVAVLYAALRVGVVVVPVDPTSPSGRVAHMLRDSAPGLVVVDGANHVRFAEVLAEHRVARTAPAGEGSGDRWVVLPAAGPPAPALELFARARPDDDIAYIIYTSGTTGVPKGVSVPRSALAAFLGAAVARAGYDAETVFLSFFPLHFDPVLMEILAPWGVGGRVVLFSGLAMINDLVSALREHAVTDFSCTPNVVSMLMSRFSTYSAERVSSLRSVWFGGEAPNPADIRAFQTASPAVRLFNGYGPTECTVACSLWAVPDLRSDATETPLAIGAPMDGTDFVVVTEDLEPVDVDSVSGELLVSGAQLMTGYWGVEGDEANGMVRREGRRYYRTGDLVHRRKGVYYFDGRISRLVKVRGYRVHPGEVEHALESAGSVRQAVVVESSPGAGLDALVEVDGIADLQALRDHVVDRLPAYMLPTRIVATDRLPRTAGGKVDMDGVVRQIRGARA